MIKVSAPGKLMLFGEHAVIHGKPCIVSAVDARMRVFLKKRKDNKIFLNIPDLNLKNYFISIDDLDKPTEKEVRFVLTAIKNFFEKYKVKRGLEIETKSEFSMEYGLGSSSAVTVATIKALSEFFEIKMGNKELFDLAYKTILDIQGVGSGFDVATAIYGGTLYFVTGGKLIEKIKVKDIPLVIGYSGEKADTPSLVKMVNEKLKESPEKIKKIFDEIEKIVNLARIEIENKNWKEVGKLMNLNQDLLRKLGVSSKKLENLIKAALDSGAYGAKLSGAGGGDCMIAIADLKNRKSVEMAIEKAGGKIIKLKVPGEGVKIE
jgi:mevalonate kinase